MFDVEFKQGMSVWPLLTVELLSFVQQDFTGVFEFFDLPGIDEATVNNLVYIDIVESVRRCVYAIVPIVSLKQISTNHWRSILPNIVGTAIETPLVICTHLDQVDHKNDNVEVLRSIAWKVLNLKSDNADVASKCVCCSSLLGFGAQRLLSLTLAQNTKPSFESIFDESRYTPEYECATQICGVGRSARRNYERLSFDEWRDELDDVIDRSGVKRAVSQFTNVLLNAQSAALSAGIANIDFIFTRILDVRKSALQRLGRTREECEVSKKAFDAAKKEINAAKRSWIARDRNLRENASGAIEDAFLELEANLLQSARDNFKKELDSFKKEHGAEGISNLSLERVRFNDESKSKLFLSGFQPKAVFAMELIKNQFIERTRRNIVDQQITSQIDFLSQCLSSRLDGTQKGAIIGRIIAETVNIPAETKNVSLSDLFQYCRQRVRETFDKGCGKTGENFYSVIDEKKVIDSLKRTAIDPLVSDIRRMAVPEFNRLMNDGRDEVESVIKKLLEKEDRDFAKELANKDTPPSPKDVAAAVASYLNFSAAASAIGELRSQYEKHSAT
ncbi:uncharacterized protein FOMMEDRAFT_142611 [Fomitiporia mediterranea MF3/22]|uniref:uncharacterized protein n=1 Tax=Fomitiporia mediterranea (strain MF3/22) TaxID=694068 RepID=UPI000440877C|nr:uncharacterized protein FOMMEDRAFT_142611 [Fomitiporia mediterranea MF3/22]EJD00264.1 hypothetical protein FOMMEDRAFT_142611 [Fomitiporia mediterranea MF3/22]